MAKGDITQIVQGGASDATIDIAFATTPNSGDLLIFIVAQYAEADVAGAAMAAATELADSDFTGQVGLRRLQIFGRVCGASETNSYAVTATAGKWKRVIAYRIEGAFTDLSGIVVPDEVFSQYITSRAIPAAAAAYSGAVRAIVACEVDSTTVTFSGFGTAQQHENLFTSTQTFSGTGTIQTTATFAAEANGASGAMVIIPLAAPTLSFVVEPEIVAGTPTTSGGQLRLTTNLAATTVKVQDTASGSTQPDPSTFTALPNVGPTVAYTVFTHNITGQAANTTRRKWVQISDGTTTLYDYADLTTLAVTSNILSVNGGQPIKEGSANIQVIRAGGATGTTSTSLNGVAQSGHTVVSDNESNFDWVWPNVLYGNPTTININGTTTTTPAIIPADGSSFVTAGAGYSPSNAGSIDAFPDAVPSDQLGYINQGGAVSVDDLWRVTYNDSFNGTLVCWIVDAADGTRSANASIPIGTAVDTTPDVPTLIANVPSANPAQVVQGSFVLAGVTAATDIPVVAAGFMEVATSNSGPWLPSITRQNGQTVHYRITAGTFGAVRTGNVSMNGVTAVAPLSVTTRAANAPTITSPISGPSSVTVNAPASFTAGLTGMATIQWRVNGVNHAGATAIPFVYTPTVVGTYSIDYVATSAEGATVTGTAVSLSVIAVANRVLLPELRSRVTNLLRGGEQNVACYVVSDNRAQVLIPATTINLASSGTTPLVNNLLGAIGTWVRVGFPESDGTAVEVRLQVEA